MSMCVNNMYPQQVPKSTTVFLVKKVWKMYHALFFYKYKSITTFDHHGPKTSHKTLQAWDQWSPFSYHKPYKARYYWLLQNVKENW